MKFRCPDISFMEQLIIKRGAVLQESMTQSDVYYSHPCLDFGRTDEALRIRNTTFSDNQEKFYLTYKGAKLSDNAGKSRCEYELPISQPEDMHEILSHMGFGRVDVVKKERRTYLLEGVEICLDKVTGLGEFVELEVGSDMDNYRVNIETIRTLSRELNLSEEITKSYLELLMEKKGMLH